MSANAPFLVNKVFPPVSASRVTKKPEPAIARSSSREEASKPPWLNTWAMDLSRVPWPAVLLDEDTISPNSVRLFLKP